jgi:shikimate dehydrogenase
MNITGHTKPFAVLGHPIGHTLSPVMHNAAMAALKMDAIYLAFDVHPEYLMDALAAMNHMGFVGANLTVPLKEVAGNNLQKLDESAQRLGVVNTVKFAPDGITGYNTDSEGFLKAMEEAFDGSIAGKSVFVLGTGGAGRAVALACAGAGVTSIYLSDADSDRCRKLAVEIETKFFIETVNVVSSAKGQAHAARDADLIVQATPVGMKPDEPSLLGPEAFRKGQLAFDLIYMYPETAFMKAAKKGGARASNGLGMLLHQGAKAFEIWTGVKPPIDVMRKTLEKAVYEK